VRCRISTVEEKVSCKKNVCNGKIFKNEKIDQVNVVDRSQTDQRLRRTTEECRHYRDAVVESRNRSEI